MARQLLFYGGQKATLDTDSWPWQGNLWGLPAWLDNSCFTADWLKPMLDSDSWPWPGALKPSLPCCLSVAKPALWGCLRGSTTLILLLAESDSRQ